MQHISTKAKPLPSLDVLNERLLLDRERGFLFWKPRHESSFQTALSYHAWVAKSEGQRADRKYRGGYYRVRISFNGKTETFGAHRIYAILALCILAVALIETPI